MKYVYFSNVSNNTHRFVEKLELEEPALRIPIFAEEKPLIMEDPYILIVPTYGNGEERNFVPKQVVKFINANHKLIRGVIGAGNTNFGQSFCAAGRIIANKCKVPLIDRVEIFGTPDDIERISQRLEEFCQQHSVT